MQISLQRGSTNIRWNKSISAELDQGWWTMQNVIKNLLLAIGIELGLKSVGCCFHPLEFRVYNNN